MTDPYITFVSGVQALRRQAEAMSWGIGGALGVAADPYPHQLSNVHRILSDIRVRHLIADEVGLGKTVQALMVINALRWQNPSHRTVIIAPERLIGQWQAEVWTRAHVSAAVVGDLEYERIEQPPIVLVRPRDIQDRAFSFDKQSQDLLIIDEPQSISIEIMRRVAAECSGISTADRLSFRQILVLSATPRLSDPRWREIIYEILEPERAGIAQSENERIGNYLESLEDQALEVIEQSPDVRDKKKEELAYLTYSVARRITRQTRKDWGQYFPERRNFEIRFEPIEAELERLNLANELIEKYPDATDLSKSPWSDIKGFFRSRRSARAALDGLDEEHIAPRIAKIRADSVYDLGDSRFEALLDVLSTEWSATPEERFVIVAGDAPTIDMLNSALPRYFSNLEEKGSIALLKRPSAAMEETSQDVRQMHEAVQPFIDGDAKILLLGDWIQAGINLHHSSRNMIFYSIPWDPQSVDQLIGRIDRLRRNGLRKGREGRHFGYVRIWRLLMRRSPEEAISDAMDAIGLLDRPLPQISEEDSTFLNAQIVKLARNPNNGQTLKALREAALEWDARGLNSKLDKFDPVSSVSNATKFQKKFEHIQRIEPSMGGENSGNSPVEQAEIANRNWMRVLEKSGIFNLTFGRKDKVDPAISFQTIWYAQKRNSKPFPLSDLQTDNWMTDHSPFIIERRHLSSPPRTKVITDEGEEDGRLLRFFDHGDTIHDDLVHGFIKLCDANFRSGLSTQEISVRVAAEHPTSKFGRKALLLSVGLSDVGRALDCDQIPERLQVIRDESRIETPQRMRLNADILEFTENLRSDQRWLRSIIPASLELRASYQEGNSWVAVEPSDVSTLFKAIVEHKNLQPFPRTINGLGGDARMALVNDCKSNHVLSIQAAIKKIALDHMKKSSLEAERRLHLIESEAGDLLNLRQKQWESGRQENVGDAQRDMVHGQLLALERRLRLADAATEERRKSLLQAMQRIASTYQSKLWHLSVRFVPEES